MKATYLVALTLLTASTLVSAMEAPTVALGEKLFKANDLGTNGKSCSSCHPGGKGLEEIGAYDDGQLREMVNFCIRDALKGKMMDLESTEIESFLMYLRSLKTEK